MYLAQASMRNGQHIGSTRMHKDITAAYNISIEGRALWTIWPSWASERLCQFIVHKGLADPNAGNPIHQQIVYLSQDAVREFSTVYGVAPFVFFQDPGQMVCIPSNCPHQVRLGICYLPIPFLSFYRYLTWMTASNTPMIYSRKSNCPKFWMSRQSFGFID